MEQKETTRRGSRERKEGVALCVIGGMQGGRGVKTSVTKEGMGRRGGVGGEYKEAEVRDL